MPIWSFRLNVSTIFTCREIQRVQLVDCSYQIGGEQSETMMAWSSDVQFYSEGRLGLGGAVAQGSPDHDSCVGANSHKSCVDQRDYWVIKFRSSLNLFDLTKLWTLWGGYGEDRVRWTWNQELFNCALMWEHRAWWLSWLERIQVKEKIVRIMIRIRCEGRRSFRNQEQITLHSLCTC